MKRFWLFAPSAFYPYGGMEDFYGDYDSVGEAIAAHEDWCTKEDPTYPKGHIFDVQERCIVLIYDDPTWKEPGKYDRVGQFKTGGLYPHDNLFDED